ncbi:MAG TPA: hypothetical protein DDY93_04795 [Dehalococcoidia bacterium]|nr:hypothetical protein [Dehalococcoidia bacterium]
MSDVRVCVVGAGANTTARHIPLLQGIDGVEIVGVVNRSESSSSTVAKRFGIPKTYGYWEQAVADRDTNTIVIGTWPYLHCPVTLAALAAGKHVLTEARMAMNSGEAGEMLAASKASPGLVAQIVPAPHTLKVDAFIEGLIADGYLGELLSIDLTAHQGDFIDYGSPVHWRHDRDLSGNNIMQMGIWYEGMMRWVGPAEAVSAVGRVHVKHRTDGSGARRHITVPDHVEILAEMASGPVARIKLSTVTGHAPSAGVWIFGSEGTLHLDTASMTLSGGRRGDDGLSVIDIPDDKKGGWRVEEEFINAIRGIEPITHTNFYDGVRYMEFTDAVTMSIQTGERIQLPL